MDFPEKKKYILNKLVENVRIVVEHDGYQSGVKPEELFNVFEETDSLSNFKTVIGETKSIIETEDVLFKEVWEKLEKINGLLSGYASDLAKNAEIGHIDVSKVNNEHYKKLARIFEKRHKKDLTIVSPSAWIG